MKIIPKEIQTKIANNVIDDLIQKTKKNPHHMTLYPDIVYENIDQYGAPKKIIHSVITPNGEKFIFADDTRIQILNAHSGLPERKVYFDKTFLHYLYYNRSSGSFDKYDKSIKKIIVSPDNSKIAALSKSAAKVWDIETGTLNCSIGEHSFWSGPASEFSTHVFEFSHDGKNFITIEKRNDDITPQLRVWDTSTGKNAATLAHCPQYCATFHPKATIIALDNQDKIVIWDYINSNSRHIRHYNLRNLAYSKDETKFLSHSLSKLKIWDTKNYQCLRTINSKNLIISHAKFSPDARFILATSNSDSKEWNTESGEKIHTFYTGTAQYSCDGTKIIFSKCNHIYDAESHKQLYTLDDPATQSIHSTPHEKIICTSSDKINIYKLPNIKKALEWLEQNLSIPQAINIRALNKKVSHLPWVDKIEELNQIPLHTLKLVVDENTLKGHKLKYTNPKTYINQQSSAWKIYFIKGIIFSAALLLNIFVDKASDITKHLLAIIKLANKYY